MQRERERGQASKWVPTPFANSKQVQCTNVRWHTCFFTDTVQKKCTALTDDRQKGEDEEMKINNVLI